MGFNVKVRQALLSIIKNRRKLVFEILFSFYDKKKNLRKFVSNFFFSLLQIKSFLLKLKLLQLVRSLSMRFVGTLTDNNITFCVKTIKVGYEEQSR